MTARRRHAPVVAGVALVAALLGGLSAAPAAAEPVGATQDGAPPVIRPPGSYVDPEGPSDAVLPPPTGVPLVIGSGSAAPGAATVGGTLTLSSGQDFEQSVIDPSPRLRSGVAAFFASGGDSLQLQLAPDESAASLSAALAAVPLAVGVVDLVVVAGVGALAVDEHRQVAAAADQLATKLQAILLLDPPDEVVSLAAQVAAADGDAAGMATWAGELRAALSAPGDAVVFSSGLLDDQQQPVPAALAVAGLMSDVGPASDIGGAGQPIPGVTPVWSVPNDELLPLEQAGLNSFRGLPGSGAVLWGNLTLDDPGADGAAPARTALADRRVESQIEAAMQLVTTSVSFQTNDEQTWSQVNATLTAYLAALWAQGGILGATAAEAGQVSVGIPVTMTAQDILNSLMIVELEAAIVEPGEYVPLRVTQLMQGSG